MACVTITEGSAVLGELALSAGDTAFIPYVCKNIPLKVSGEAVVTE